MKLHILSVATIALATLGFHVQAGELTVTVKGIKNPEGYIRMALWGDADSFRDEDEAITVRESVATGESAVFVVPSLPAGDYAVLVHHDRDRDRRFDHMAGLFAAEGYGLSNGSAVVTDERFEDAVFPVPASEPTAIEIDLRYCDSEYPEGRPLSKTFSCWLALSP